MTINERLISNPAPQRRRITNTAELYKNPILVAIQKALGVGYKKLGSEYQICMLPPVVFDILNQTMQDKVYRDIENESGPVAQRLAVPFPTFMYDSMIMQYGL